MDAKCGKWRPEMKLSISYGSHNMMRFVQYFNVTHTNEIQPKDGWALNEWSQKQDLTEDEPDPRAFWEREETRVDGMEKVGPNPNCILNSSRQEIYPTLFLLYHLLIKDLDWRLQAGKLLLVNRILYEIKELGSGFSLYLHSTFIWEESRRNE